MNGEILESNIENLDEKDQFEVVEIKKDQIEIFQRLDEKKLFCCISKDKNILFLGRDQIEMELSVKFNVLLTPKI